MSKHETAKKRWVCRRCGRYIKLPITDESKCKFCDRKIIEGGITWALPAYVPERNN